MAAADEVVTDGPAVAAELAESSPPVPEPHSAPAADLSTSVVTTESDSNEIPEPAGLNLTRPGNFDALMDASPVDLRSLPFNKSLAEGVQARATEQRRSAGLQMRLAAVYGVSDAEYGRSGPLGREIKQDGRCYTLVETSAVEAGQRWWATQCSEARQNPFLLPAPEFDARGRLIAESVADQ